MTNLNRTLIRECRCDERLKVKDEGSTHTLSDDKSFILELKNPNLFRFVVYINQ